MNEVRRSLKLVQGRPKDQHRVPPLTAQEFDADEQVVLSPLQLAWESNIATHPSRMASHPPPDYKLIIHLRDLKLVCMTSCHFYQQVPVDIIIPVMSSGASLYYHVIDITTYQFISSRQ